MPQFKSVFIGEFKKAFICCTLLKLRLFMNEREVSLFWAADLCYSSLKGIDTKCDLNSCLFSDLRLCSNKRLESGQERNKAGRPLRLQRQPVGFFRRRRHDQIQVKMGTGDGPRRRHGLGPGPRRLQERLQLRDSPAAQDDQSSDEAEGDRRRRPELPSFGRDGKKRWRGQW